jgi:hypothetical protein
VELALRLEILKLNKKVVVSSFLNKLFWPFVVFGTILVAVEIISSCVINFQPSNPCAISSLASSRTLRGYDYDVDTLIYLSVILYVGVDGFVSILMFWAGSRVLKQLANAPKASSNSHTNRLRRATTTIMFGCVFR